MSINFNIEINSVNIFRLFYVSLISFAKILINIPVKNNMKINSIQLSRLFCVSNSSFNNNVNLFYNINSNLIFNVEIFL